MDISIREHIINNFKEDSEESIYDAIDESVKNGEEVTLPGLGVFKKGFIKSFFLFFFNIL